MSKHLNLSLVPVCDAKSKRYPRVHLHFQLLRLFYGKMGVNTLVNSDSSFSVITYDDNVAQCCTKLFCNIFIILFEIVIDLYKQISKN